MQRRKIISQIKNKPKLVLDRLPQLNTEFEKRNESLPITILNLKNINTMQKHLDQQIESHSNYKTSKKSLTKNEKTTKPPLTYLKQNKSNNHSKNPQIKDLRRLRRKSNSQHLIQNTLITLERCFISEDRAQQLKSNEIDIVGLFQKIISQCNYNRETIRAVVQKLRNFLGSEEINMSPNSWMDQRKKQQPRDMKLSICSCQNVQYLPQISKLQQKKSIQYSNNSNNLSNIQEEIYSQEQIQNKSLNNISSARFQFEHLSELDDYIMNQPNKILHEALRRHKYLEKQLFGYSDYLSISHLGACTYVTTNNIPAIQFELDRQMKELNRQIIQGTSPIDQKCKMLRDFVLFVRSSYNNTLLQLMKVNDAKTSMIKTFVNKVLKWRENYLVRKEYLSNLKKDYCSALYRIGKEIHGIRNVKEKWEFRQEKLIIGLEEDIVEIHKIFLAGNSFY